MRLSEAGMNKTFQSLQDQKLLLEVSKNVKEQRETHN